MNEHCEMNLNDNLLHFQQDGASSHYAVAAKAWLMGMYPGKWIGRRGS